MGAGKAPGGLHQRRVGLWLLAYYFRPPVYLLPFVPLSLNEVVEIYPSYDSEDDAHQTHQHQAATSSFEPVMELAAAKSRSLVEEQCNQNENGRRENEDDRDVQRWVCR